MKRRFKQMMHKIQREVLIVRPKSCLAMWSIGKKSTKKRSYRMENWTQWMIFCSLMCDVFISRLFRKTKVERSLVFPTYVKLLQGSNWSVEHGEFYRTSEFNCQDYHDGNQYPPDGQPIEQFGYLADECRVHGTYVRALLGSYQVEKPFFMIVVRYDTSFVDD